MEKNTFVSIDKFIHQFEIVECFMRCISVFCKLITKLGDISKIFYANFDAIRFQGFAKQKQKKNW